LLVGGGLVLFRLPMPARFALSLEFLAAMMLIVLGLRSLLARRRAKTRLSDARPIAIGLVHGLAGSAVLALLVLGTTTSALAAALYLVCFCVGTIAGMGIITALIAMPSALVPQVASFERALHVAAGVASLAVGLFMAHRIGVHDGLFGATATLPE